MILLLYFIYNKISILYKIIIIIYHPSYDHSYFLNKSTTIGAIVLPISPIPI